LLMRPHSPWTRVGTYRDASFDSLCVPGRSGCAELGLDAGESRGYVPEEPFELIGTR
jgi:hypothetical protein